MTQQRLDARATEKGSLLPTRALTHLWGHDADGVGKMETSGFATAAQGAKADTLPAITADTMLVNNADGTARDNKTAEEVREFLKIPSIGYGFVLPETQTWLQYVYVNNLTEPRRSLTTSIDDAIAEIVDGNAWDALDYLGAWFGPAWDLSRVSLKSPGVVTPSFTGSDLFVPGIGVKPDLTNYVLFDKSPSQLTKFQRNSASLGLMVSGGASILNGASIVGGAGTAGFTLRPVDGSNNQSIRLNQSTALVTASDFRDGFAAGSRTSSTDIANYRDGAKIGASAASPTTTDPSTAKMTVFAPAEDRFGHVFFVGGGMTDDQIFVINSAMQTLRSRIGAF